MAVSAEMKANPMAVALCRTDSTSWDIEFTRRTRGTDFVSFMRELPAGLRVGDRFHLCYRPDEVSEEAAASYDRFLRDAFARPYVIGYFRCQHLTIYKDHVNPYTQGFLRRDGTPFDEYVTALSATHRVITDGLFRSRRATE